METDLGTLGLRLDLYRTMIHCSIWEKKSNLKNFFLKATDPTKRRKNTAVKRAQVLLSRCLHNWRSLLLHFELPPLRYTRVIHCVIRGQLLFFSPRYVRTVAIFSLCDTVSCFTNRKSCYTNSWYRTLYYGNPCCTKSCCTSARCRCSFYRSPCCTSARYRDPCYTSPFYTKRCYNRVILVNPYYTRIPYYQRSHYTVSVLHESELQSPRYTKPCYRVHFTRNRVYITV